MKARYRILACLLAAVLLAGCGGQTAAEDPAYIDEAVLMETVTLEEETVALSESPAALPVGLAAEASGVLTKVTKEATIDYSNTKDGYVMVMYTAPTTAKLKAQVKGPTTTYTYNMTAGKWEVFPLTDGNGQYTITAYRNVQGTKYAAVASTAVNVTLADEFAPYLRPNQYVDYASAPNTIAKAAELTAGQTDTLAKVGAVYNYVVSNTTYDYNKAATVQSGYLPVLDQTLAEKKGICFDYAALMTGMLRSQGIPCKLVVGYAGAAYHAWINVHVEGVGWVDAAVYFDGTSWKRMDPTFASTSNRSAKIMSFINNDANYSVKYMY